MTAPLRYVSAGTDGACAEYLQAVTHTLRGEGHDASADGTGRGTPLVPEVAGCLQERDSKGVDSDTKPGHLIPMAFSCKDHGSDAGEISPTLRSMNHDGSHANGGGQIAVAFAENSRAEVRLEGGDGDRTGTQSAGGGKPGQGVPMVAFTAKDYQDGTFEETDCAGPLTTSADRSRSAPITFNLRGRDGGAMPEVDPDNLASMRASSGGSSRSYVAGMQVRRLTPVEAERLQGFPDNFTRIPYRNKTAENCPDGPRYKALGNSMAVPVMHWIGSRIANLPTKP